MPYCCKCGTVVANTDTYCAKCGARQPGAPVPPPPAHDYLSGISSRTASLLCYVPVVGWIAAIVVLASTRFRHDHKVRFNAFQGLYLFVAWLIVDWVLGPLFGMPHMFGFYHIVPVLMKAAVFGMWIFMIIKTSQDEFFKLPILGDLAEKSVTEQR
jgi:uncharacterized membrane protein